MKNKLRKLFFLSVLTGLTLLTTIGFADTNATPENHAMGSSLIQQDQEQSESPQSASPRLRSFAAAAPAVANSLVDLSPTDINIPSCDAVDVASYQSWMKQEDFNGLKAQGVKTIVVKLSEGTYYTNPYANAQIKMAQNAGLNIATYHYAIFGNTNNQTTANHAAIAEADYYAQAAQKLGLSTAITMIEDAENSGTTSSVWTQASQNFQSELSKKGYHNVKFYTSQSWATNGSMNSSTLGAKNFWVAQYLYGKPETNPTGWANTLKNNAQFGAWQYTSQMRYSGTNLQKNVLDTSTSYETFFSNIKLNGMTWINHNQSLTDFGISYSSTDPVTFTWQVYDIQNKTWTTIAKDTSSNWISYQFQKSGQYLIYVSAITLSGNSSTFSIGWNVQSSLFFRGMTWINHSNSLTDFGIAYSSSLPINFTWKIYDIQHKTWTTIAQNTFSNWVTYDFPRVGQYLVYVSGVNTNGDTTNYCIGWIIK